jgi:hypothetical protein
MRNATPARRERSDLLARPPVGSPLPDDRWLALVVDPVSQLAELADLVQRGLVAPEDFDRHKARILGRDQLDVI